jgi:predicted phosphodiesterase
MNESIAVIADVHGNTWALDAALEDIRRRAIERIVNLGDCVYGSLDPAGTAERLMVPKIVSIAGNQDRDVFAPTDEVRRSADHHFVTSRLSTAQIDWLRSLPPTHVVTARRSPTRPICSRWSRRTACSSATPPRL